tara:strand:+ start:901 stop:1293 length:393 start_codon:yes stop_codon:yes gene_type:complete
MVNYKLIADNDPVGELQTAFDSMAAEAVTSTPEVMVTYRQIGERVSLAASAELEAAVNGSELVPSWVDSVLAKDGINVNDAQVSATLGAIVSTDTAAAIIAMGLVTSPKYAGLKIGHLANARQMRAEGRV